MLPEIHNKNNSGKIEQINNPKTNIYHWPLSKWQTVILLVAVAFIVTAGIVAGACIMRRVPEQPPKRIEYTGPRGGVYYFNSRGNKVYVTPPKTAAK